MLEHVYGGMDEPELKIIDVFIYIETVWGRGYTLREPEPDLG
jgi:two-component system cell cycle response regulator CtrA